MCGRACCVLSDVGWRCWGGGLEGGFWGWCEGDGKVGFCVFYEIKGGLWRLLSGYYARYENFPQLDECGLRGFKENVFGSGACPRRFPYS